MSIQKVSLLNNISFKGEAAKEVQTAPETPNEIKDGKKKLALALGGLAVASVGAVLVMRGKKVPSKISIEEFKKIGKFDKGVAKAKGKLFTGTIDAPLKDGKTVLEYEKGILKQATRLQNIENANSETSLVPVLRKVYSKDENGAKTVETFLHNNNVGIFGGKEWARDGLATISENKTMVETPMSLGMISKRVAEKQADGSWKVHTEGDAMPIDWRKDIN